MKNLKRILSVVLIASMIFTSNAMITLAENGNQVVSSEETTTDDIATVSDADEEVSKDAKLGEPEDSDNVTVASDEVDDDNVAASAEAGASETTKATTETTAGETETTVGENTETAAETKTIVEANETTVEASESSVVANTETAAENETTVGASETTVGASESTVGANARGAIDSVATASDAEEDDNAKTDEEIKIASASTAEIKTTNEETFGAGSVYYALAGTSPNYTLYFKNSAITAADTTLPIVSSGQVVPYATDTARPWNSNNSSIRKVEILNEIKPSSMEYWFFYLSRLQEIVGLDKIDTSEVTSMANLFTWCEYLTNLDLSTFDTSNVTNMFNMFHNCKRLTSLDVSSFNTSNVTNMNVIFCNCSELVNLNLSNWNTSNATQMNSMFLLCEKLTNLDISNFDTSNATGMEQMFSGCKALTSLDLSHFDTSNVTSMSGMFANSNALTNLNISSFDTSNVTAMNTMFYNCNALTNLNISNFDTSRVTDMKYMFSGCTNLTELHLSNFDTSSVTNMSYMFQDCTNLTRIGVSSSFVTTNVTAANSSSNMFSGCTALTGGKGSTLATVPGGNTDKTYAKIDGGTANPGLFSEYIEYTFGNDYKGVLYNAGVDFDTELINITFEKYPTAAPTSFVSERDIPNSNGLKLYILTNANDNTKNDVIIYAPADGVIKAPANCEQLFSTFHANKIESINNLTYLDTSDVTNMVNMFNGTECLTSLDLSGFNTSNVTTMERMFIGCGVSTLDLSSFDTSNVTTMEMMFTGCERLTSVNLSSFNTSNVTSMAFMFSDCKELTSLDLSSFNTSSVTTMQHMFSDCRALTNLNISSFDTSNVTNMLGMFLSCQAITSLDLSHFNTSNVTNMDSFISGCEKLTSIDLSSFDTSNVTNIGYMFSFCIALTTLDLSSFNTSNVTNMAGMFSGCPNLNLIKVDSSKFNTANVTDSDEMFMNCHKLIGYQETKFDASHIDVSYAHIDAADNGNPGYFSEFPRIFIYDGTTRLSRQDYTMANIGHTVTEPTKPTKTGYYFAGWYKEEALTNEFNFATDVLPGNMFLYVKWSTTPPKQVSTIEVKPNTIVKTTYDKGDPFDPTGLVLKVNYDDGTSEEIDYATHTGEISFNPTTISSSGNVVITYKGQTTTVAVRVNGDPTPIPKTIKSVDINRTPRRTTYTEGDYIDPTGIVLKVTYDDNTTETITYDRKTKNDFTFKPALDTPLTSDDKEVVITYGKKTVRFSIVVDKKSDPTPSTGGNGGNSGGGSDPTKGPMGDLTKNPEYAKLLDPLANPVPTQPIDQTLNTTNNLPQEDLIYDTKLIDALKSFPENANPTKANVEDTDGNKGYGEWLNVPRTTTWYFLTGNLKPEDVATMSAKESGGFLRSGWYNLGWKGENKWYHFNTGGVMDIGWYTENNLIYYLEADLQDNWYGKAVTGTKVIDGITYNFGTNGALIP